MFEMKSRVKMKSRTKSKKFKVASLSFGLPLLVLSIFSFLVIGERYGVNAKDTGLFKGSFIEEETRIIDIETWDEDHSEKGYGWRVYSNKDEKSFVDRRAEEYSPTFSNSAVQYEVKLMSGLPLSLLGTLPRETSKMLGLRFNFNFPGRSNVINIEPPSVDYYRIERQRFYRKSISISKKKYKCFDDPKYSAIKVESQENLSRSYDCVVGILLPGNVQAIKIWVLSRGYDYTLKAWLEDWHGDTHIIKLGDLKHIGWKSLHGEVPNHVYQVKGPSSGSRSLILRRLQIHSENKNLSEEDMVYLFFDQLRIVTNLYKQFYDGGGVDFDQADCLRKRKMDKLTARKRLDANGKIVTEEDCK